MRGEDIKIVCIILATQFTICHYTIFVIMQESERIIPAKQPIYLEGPKSRIYEFGFAWRIFTELIKGFRTLHFIGPCITVFGSARFKEDNFYYQTARAFGKEIAAMGFTTMTGGGPGIMEAANRGAFENKGASAGCNIQLPYEQMLNPYTQTSITFTHFFVRKTMMIKYSYAFIIMPGGFGTMDEFFETLTLVQTKMLAQFPIVLFGKQYYKQLWELLTYMAEQSTISIQDLSLVLLTDSVEEAMLHVKTYISSNYELKHRKRLWWLFEK
jgi:uncharacterized protein (TIGR00730 family)